jgi:uncharacterized oligopeptide transporter (OPT) family protein
VEFLLPRKIVREPSTETGSEISKSPITKRAVIYGLIVGTLYVFLAIYTSLKTGVTFIAGSVLVGYILLSLRGKYNPQENVIITTIAEGSILVGVGVIASLPAIVIYSWTISQRKLDPVFYFVNSLFGNLSGNIWYDSLITPELLIAIGLFAGVLGLFLVFPLKEQLLKLPWPGAVPVYRTIEGLGEVEEAKRTLLRGIGLGAAYTGIFTALGVALRQNIFQLPTVSVSPTWLTALNPFKTLWLSTLPQWQQTLIQWLTSNPLPNFLGIANSPLIGAIGYFVGWKRALVIFAGAVWSIIVWMVCEGGSRLATYGTHFMLPMIYYTSMGVLISYITWELAIKNLLKYHEDQKKMKELREQIIKAAAEGKIDAKQAAPYLEAEKMGRLAKIKQSTTLATARFKETMQVDKRKLLPMIISVALFAAGTILIFNTNNPLSQNILGIKVLDVPWYLILATTPLLPFSGWWLTVILGEAGIAANYLTDSIVVPAILLFSVNLPSIVIFTTILGTWQQSAARLIARVRVGRELKVKDRIITKSMLIGIVPGAFISTFIIMLLYSYGGFGTAQFPAPAAAVTGLFFMSMVELRTLWLGGAGAGLPTTPTDPTAIWFQFLYEQSKPFYLQSWFIGGDQSTGVIPIGAAIFFIAGFAIGLALAKYDWSPISLAVGLIIPPYIATTMFLGGILNYYVYRKHKANKEQYQKEEMKYQNALAGVATGDGVAQILWILSTMFLI